MVEKVVVKEKVIYEREKIYDTDPRFARHVSVRFPLEKTDAFGKRSKAAGKDLWRKRCYVPIYDLEGLNVAEGVKIGESAFKKVFVYPLSGGPCRLDGQRPDVAGHSVWTRGHSATPTPELVADGAELNAPE